MEFRFARTAVTVLAGAAALGLGSAPAALAAPADGSTYFVPCSGYALYNAVNNAYNGETLVLTPNCTYYLQDGLGTMRTITIVGHNSTITQARDAGGFSLLTVENCVSANVTVINVNFTGGGGNTADGGAIYNNGVLTVEGGTFSDNTSTNIGGAIYNDGEMRVTGATFTHNSSNEGGAIYNEGYAVVNRSAFTWNSTDGADPYGGAIYNEDELYLSGGGFLANSASYGGAIDNEYELYATHTTITANAASVDGGGIYNDDETANVSDSAIFGNQPNNCYDVPGCLG